MEYFQLLDTPKCELWGQRWFLILKLIEIFINGWEHLVFHEWTLYIVSRNMTAFHGITWILNAHNDNRSGDNNNWPEKMDQFEFWIMSLTILEILSIRLKWTFGKISSLSWRWWYVISNLSHASVMICRKITTISSAVTANNKKKKKGAKNER